MKQVAGSLYAASLTRLAIISIAFVPSLLLATDIQVESRINIAEFDAKYVKSSWCIFSEGHSSTDSSQISASRSGENNQFLQTFRHRGKTYLRRKVAWQSETTAKNFTLSFHSDSGRFSDSERYADHTCSYRRWRGQSTSGEIVLTARAAFLIPRNVWAIRVTSKTDALGARAKITLASDDYVLDDGGKTVLKRVDFFGFSGNAREKYFLSNASTKEQENFVYLDFKYIKKTLSEADLDIEFTVDFIAAEECLSELEGKSYLELIAGNLGNSRMQDALVNMACMLNPDYIRHALSTLYLYDIDALFKSLDDVEGSVQASISTSPDEASLANFKVLLQLIDRVRFYYAYEILKESMSLLTSEIIYDNARVDSLYYIEILRRRGVLYLFTIYNDLLSTVNSAAATSSGPFVKLSSNGYEKFELLRRSLLPYEYKSFKKAHDLVYSPRYLSAAAYSEFLQSADDAVTAADRFLNTADLVLQTPDMSRAQAERLSRSIGNAIDQLRLYVNAFDRFQAHIAISSDEIEPSEARKRLLVQLETLFNLRLRPLMEQVSYYYLLHFEDPAFRDIEVNGKRYESVASFIKDMKELLTELKQ